MIHQKKSFLKGHWEAQTHATHLPRCEECEAPHPGATSYWTAPATRIERPKAAARWTRGMETCPECGAAAAYGRCTYAGPATFTGEGLGVAGAIGRWFLWIAAQLRTLAERLEP